MLLPVECLLLVVTPTVLLLYRYFQIPLREPLELYESRVLGAFGWYLLGLALCPLFLRLADLKAKNGLSRGETWQRFQRDYLSFSRLLFDLRLVHALGLVFVLFIQLKHLTPFLRADLLDSSFLLGEQRVLGGKLAAEWMIDLFGLASASFLSTCYTLFFPYMGLLLGLLLLQRDCRLARDFAMGFASLWFLGVLAIYLFPTWGPCFFRPDLFARLPESGAKELISELWRGKTFVEKNPQSPAGVFLISGFPSLHLAVVTYGSLVLGRLSVPLARISAVFLILTVLSTLYFGWHYLLDDIGGFLLGWLVYALFVTSRGAERLSYYEKDHLRHHNAPPHRSV